MRKKNLKSMKNRNLFSCLLTVMFFVPALVYLSLIGVVLARPEVLTLFGLQPFVDYVTYELQFNGYKNLVTQQLWGPGFEVYYFQMSAAAILIVGILSFVICIWVTILAVLFSDLFYCRVKYFRNRKSWFGQIFFMVLIIFCLYILFYSPEIVDRRNRSPSILLYRDAVGWAGFLVLWSTSAFIACSHITILVKRCIIVRRTVNPSS